MKTLNSAGVLILSALTFATPRTFAGGDSPRMIGAVLAGGEFASTDKSYPGYISSKQYRYPRDSEIDMAKAIGVELVRVPFKWDRIQHLTNGVLDANLSAEDIEALDASIDAMEARGMRVILDMHNYAKRSLGSDTTLASYTIGSPELPASDFAQVWRLLADHYKNRTSIWGYDLMNEPMGVTTTDLVTYYQAAVNAIREVDPKTAIILEGGPNWNHASGWLTTGAPLINVVDPSNNLIFSAHCYTDRDQSGGWSHGGTVAAELVGSGKPYSTIDDAYNVGVDRVKPFVDWCVANNVRGLVGEYGSPYITDDVNWNIVTDRMLAYMVDHGNGLISGTQWAEGGLNAGDQKHMMPHADNSSISLQDTVLPNYLSGIGTYFWNNFIWFGKGLTQTGNNAFGYAYPAGDVTIDWKDANDHFGTAPGDTAVHVSYTLPPGTYGGGGLHMSGPSSVGAIGGVDIRRNVIARQVLSFYAKGPSDAVVAVTLGKTSDASGVDTGQDTGTGNWTYLNSIAPLDPNTWQYYEIPLSSILNSQVTGNERVQRFRFTLGPADNVARDIHFDSIVIQPSVTNTLPSVTIDTSTSGSTFPVNTPVGLVATASDADSGDWVDYVELYADGDKVGLSDTAPYTASAAFAAPGPHTIRAIAYDSHGVAGTGTKTLTIVQPAPTGLALLTGDTDLYLTWSAAAGATSYNVKRATASGGPYTTIANVTSPSYTDSGLTNGVTYYYIVTAVDSYGESAATAEISGTPQSVTLIQDNMDATGVAKVGGWAASDNSPGYYGTNYWHDGNNGATGGRKVTYTPTITTSGYYDVYARWTTNPNRATNVPVDINSATGTTTVTVNQQNDNGVWVLLGRYQLNAGASGNVVIRNDGANGYVIADAVEYILR